MKVKPLFLQRCRYLIARGDNVALHTVSLCTGLGGIERGLEIAAPKAFKPILYCERELSVAAIIANEIEAGSLSPAPIWSDVKTITRGSVARYLDRVGVDCITGGYPCQPFSYAGKQLGEDDPRHLWPFIAQAIERYSPTLCFFENVAGHLVLEFREVCECLERMDYRVAAGIFTASEIGASHRRERLFILGMENASRVGQNEALDENDASSHGNRKTTESGNGGWDVEYDASIRRHGDSERPERDTVKEKRLQNIGGRHLPPFSPGPNADWRSIVEQWPELAPAVVNAEHKRARREASSGQSIASDKTSCRSNEKRKKTTRQKQTTESIICSLVDGVSRADQLRALGNSVVPQCAAVAFLSLWAALMESR